MSAREKWLPFLCVVCLVCLLVIWAEPEGGQGEPVKNGSTAVRPEIEAIEGLPRSAPPRSEEGRSRAESTPAVADRSSHEFLGASGSAGLAGRVVDGRGTGQIAALVILQRGSQRLETDSGPDGGFRFEDLPPGHYRLFVEPRSLAQGLLAPWRQSVCRPYGGAPTGIHGTSFQLREGEQRAVDLRVHRAATLAGSLEGPQGEPLAGALVSLSSELGPHKCARSDELGRFHLADLHPGAYVLQVSAQSSPALEPGSAPLPQTVELAPGEARELEVLRFGAGGHRLRGRVVDQAGAPVAGLTLVCEQLRSDDELLSWRAVTGTEGDYCFGRLPSTPVVVRVAQGQDRVALHEPRLAELPEPVPAQLEHAPAIVDLGDLRVTLVPAFTLLGRVEVDPDWVRGRRLDPYVLELHVPDPESIGGTRALPIDRRRGEFRWSCPTPAAAQRLTVVFRSPDGEERRQDVPLQPIEGALERVVVRFP